MDRFAEAPRIGDAEQVLLDLIALDAAEPGAAAMHDPVGDLYSDLADDCFGQNSLDEAIRLQRLAVDQPCSNSAREVGLLLGYRFTAGDAAERDATTQELQATRAVLDSKVDEAYLVSSFAEAIEIVAEAQAAPLHDEALAIAHAAGDEEFAAPPEEPGRPFPPEAADGADTDEPPYDPIAEQQHFLDAIRIPRALLRREHGETPDGDDLVAFQALEEIGQRFSPANDSEAIQLFVPRSELAAARERWPEEADELGMDEPDAFYADLELLWRQWPKAGGAIVLRPLTVAQLEAHDASPAVPADALPPALVEELETEGDGIAWPPGRNDACWCGSERKYKRCCGAA